LNEVILFEQKNKHLQRNKPIKQTLNIRKKIIERTIVTVKIRSCGGRRNIRKYLG